MAQVVIRDLDDETIRRLRARARRHGRSLQREVKLILTRAAGLSFNDARKLAQQWHKKLAGREIPDISDLIRQDRQRGRLSL
jgi:plasmid stability protein